MSAYLAIVVTHSPAFSRQWLDQRILLELLNATSFRKKDKKNPSLLYCPGEFEEELVHYITMSTKTDNMNNIPQQR